MNKKSKYMFFIFFLSFILIAIEIIYLYSYKNMDIQEMQKKQTFVRYTGLPDLAISTEATYIRHRSLSTIHSIYRDDGVLREYFPSTYAISYSHIKD